MTVGDKVHNVLFCGIGGQGVLKAAEVLGLAAMAEGYHVRKSEVHGMSQRGGSVESHLRFGREVYSPLIPRGQADFVVCFNADEGRRLHFFLRKAGLSFVPFLERAEKELSDPRFLNTYLLGVLSRFLPLSQDAWLSALAQAFPKAIEQNKEAFVRGFAAR